MATRADIAQIGSEIREGFDQLLTLLAKTIQHPGTVQQVTVPQAVTAAPQRTERLVWIMCVVTAVMAMVAGGAVVAAILQGQRISDMRADFARAIDKVNRDQAVHEAWAREESNIVRGYIWTGKVPVANPYPKQIEAEP